MNVLEDDYGNLLKFESHKRFSFIYCLKPSQNLVQDLGYIKIAWKNIFPQRTRTWKICRLDKTPPNWNRYGES